MNTQNPNRTRDPIHERLLEQAKESPGYLLLTLMDIDLKEFAATRVLSSDHQIYPLTGKKSLMRNQWFEQVIVQKNIFVANSPESMGDQFYDKDLFAKLGCGSVVNVPIVRGGQTVAVLNILHQKGHFTPQKVEEAKQLTKLL